MSRITIFVVLAAIALTGCQRSNGLNLPTAPSAPRVAEGPLGPNADAEGAYVLTFTADGSCDQLPLSIRSRTYNATVTRSGIETFEAELSGASFYPNFGSLWISSTNPWNSRFHVQSTYALNRWLDDIPLYERLAGGGYVALGGIADVPFDKSTPSGSVTFAGEFTYCATPTNPSSDIYPPACVKPVTCHSDKHKLTLVRK
jgi:hypothetical protein